MEGARVLPHRAQSGTVFGERAYGAKSITVERERGAEIWCLTAVTNPDIVLVQTPPTSTGLHLLLTRPEQSPPQRMQRRRRRRTTYIRGRGKVSGKVYSSIYYYYFISDCKEILREGQFRS